MGESIDEFATEAPGVIAADSRYEGQFVHVYDGRLDDEDDDVRIIATAPEIDEKAVYRGFRRVADGWQNASTHPNIVSVYERGTTPRPWIAVARATGRPLTDAQSNLTPTEIETVVDTVAAAVRNAALYNTTHGALSPETVTVVPGDEEISALVDDWGLRQTVSTAAGTFDVTPFTAPELLDDPTSGDERTDVYGLGAVAYYALTGEPPISGTDLETAVRDGSVTPPSDHDDALSQPVDEVLLRALATDPTERYDSAFAFKTAFSQAYSPAERSNTDGRETDPVVTGSSGESRAVSEHDGDRNGSSGTTRRAALGVLGLVGVGGGWVFLTRTSDEENSTATTDPTDSTDSTTEPSTESETSTEPLFSDEFEDDSYRDVWSFQSDNAPDDDVVRETDGLLEHVSASSYTNGATLLTDDVFPAEGTKRIEARMRTRVSDYWGYGFGLESAGGTIELREHKWEGYDRFGVNGVEERPPEYSSQYDDNYEYYDDTHFANVAAATTDTAFMDYSLTVDFESEEIVALTRGNSEFQLSLDTRDFGSEYRISIGTGRGHEVEYESIQLYDL